MAPPTPRTKHSAAWATAKADDTRSDSPHEHLSDDCSLMLPGLAGRRVFSLGPIGVDGRAGAGACAA
jgi:hypothetical protein